MGVTVTQFASPPLADPKVNMRNPPKTKYCARNEGSLNLRTLPLGSSDMRRFLFNILLASVTAAVLQGGASAESRYTGDLPGDRCNPGYGQALGRALTKSLSLHMQSDEAICRNKDQEVISALERLASYGRNPGCFSDPYWYRAYQPWLDKFIADNRQDANKVVRAACARVRSKQAEPEEPSQINTDDGQYCSSKDLGNKMNCINLRKLGDVKWSVEVMPVCSGTYYAVIATFGILGECKRTVIQVSSAKSEVFWEEQRIKPPSVIDAIAAGSLKRLNCYTKRHNNKAC